MKQDINKMKAGNFTNMLKLHNGLLEKLGQRRYLNGYLKISKQMKMDT